MNEPRNATAASLPLLAVVVALLGILAIASIHAIGLAGTIFLGGIIASFTFVALTVHRRRPVDLD